MTGHSNRTLDRTGAVAGIAAVVFLLAILIVMKSLPAPDKPIGAIAASARDDASSLLWGAYLGTLAGLALLAFGAVVAAALRRVEGNHGGWWLVALVGVAGTSIGIVGDAAVITFVRAVGHGVTGDTLWIGYGFDHWVGVLVAAPLGLFVFAAAMGSRSSGLLPRWLSWAGIGIAPLLVVGAASVTGDEVSGGILGVPLFLGYLTAFIWIIATSVCLWRVPRERAGAHKAAIA